MESNINTESAILRGWRDTMSTLGGGWPLVIFTIAVPITGLSLHYIFSGATAMIPELEIWLVYGLASIGIVFLAILAINIFAAPVRQRNEVRLICDQKEVQISQLKNPYRLSVTVDFAQYGGKAEFDRTINGAVDGAPIVLFVTVSNLGDRQTVCKNWAVKANLPNGEIINCTLIALDGDINMTNDAGRRSKVGSDQWIVKATNTPIISGSVTNGVILAFVDGMPPNSAPNDFYEIEFSVSTMDIAGTEYSGSMKIKARNDGWVYHPSLRTVWST